MQQPRQDEKADRCSSTGASAGAGASRVVKRGWRLGGVAPWRTRRAQRALERLRAVVDPLAERLDRSGGGEAVDAGINGVETANDGPHQASELLLLLERGVRHADVEARAMPCFGLSGPRGA